MEVEVELFCKQLMHFVNLWPTTLLWYSSTVQTMSDPVIDEMFWEELSVQSDVHPELGVYSMPSVRPMRNVTSGKAHKDFAITKVVRTTPTQDLEGCDIVCSYWSNQMC